MKKLLATISFLLFSQLSFAAEEVIVKSVYDGDTFTVEIDGKEEKVRVLGIDTPELKKGKKDTCRGEEVADFAKNLLEGKAVILEKDSQSSDRGYFGRLLRTVEVDDLDFGLVMLMTGNAKVYRNAPFSQKQLYIMVENFAKKKKKGVWSDYCIAENAQNTSDQIEETALEENVSEEAIIGENTKKIIKMSKSGICHAPWSKYYNRTKNYTPFDNLKDCIKAGGRVPRR